MVYDGSCTHQLPSTYSPYTYELNKNNSKENF